MTHHHNNHSTKTPPQQQHLLPDNITPTTDNTPSPFHELPPDCLSIITQYHTFHLQCGNEWKKDYTAYTEYPTNSIGNSLYDLEMEGTSNLSNSSLWNFLKKYAHCCCFYGEKGLLEFLSTCRDWEHKRTFSCLKLVCFTCAHLCRTGAVQYLRGVPELHFDMLQPDTTSTKEQNRLYFESLFMNIRGVQKLTVTVCEDQIGEGLGRPSEVCLQNLRGIQEAHFEYCNFGWIPDEAFENLRGIKSLTFDNCQMHRDLSLLKHLRGVQELRFRYCEDCPLYDEDFRNIRGVKCFSFTMGIFVEDEEFSLKSEHLKNLRGVQELKVVELSKIRLPVNPSLTDESFSNLRGVKKLELSHCELSQVTNAAFANLRGVEEISLSFIRGTAINNLIFQHLGEVRRLTIRGCPSMEFEPETLGKLQSIQELSWRIHPHTQNGIVLDNETANQLDRVEGLHLHGVVVATEEAFQYLSNVSIMTLNASATSVPVSVAALSHLKQIRCISLEGIKLQGWSTLPNHFSVMPHLERFNVSRCTVEKDAIQWIPEVRWDGCEVYFILKKKESFGMDVVGEEASCVNYVIP